MKEASTVLEASQLADNRLEARLEDINDTRLKCRTLRQTTAGDDPGGFNRSLTFPEITLDLVKVPLVALQDRQ